MYTFDTAFRKDDISKPLRRISLGILSPERITVRVQATALLVDTRTGFVYGALESNERRD